MHGSHRLLTFPEMKKNTPNNFKHCPGREVAAEWSEVCTRFFTAQQQKPSERLKFFGELFEDLQPWLTESIDRVSNDNYFLVSTEAIVSYLFILLLKREQLPPVNGVFDLWVESLSLSKANKILEIGAKLQGCPGEAPLDIQQKFNKLTKRQRAIFYLYIIERGQLAEVSQAVGIPAEKIKYKMPKLWDAVGVNESFVPYGWRKKE